MPWAMRRSVSGGWAARLSAAQASRKMRIRYDFLTPLAAPWRRAVRGDQAHVAHFKVAADVRARLHYHDGSLARMYGRRRPTCLDGIQSWADREWRIGDDPPQWSHRSARAAVDEFARPAKC